MLQTWPAVQAGPGSPITPPVAPDPSYARLGVPQTFTAAQRFAGDVITSGRPALDPVFWGADPTGSVVSTTAIQTALTALGNGQRLVLVGTFLLDNVLTIANKVGFVIDASHATFNFVPGAGVTSASGASSLLTITGCTDFTLQGLTAVQVTQPILYTDHTLEFNGVTLINCKRGNVLRCHLRNWRWTGLGEFDPVALTSQSNTFEANHVWRCRFGISVNGYRTRIAGNWVTDEWDTSAEATAKGGVWSAPSFYYDGILLDAGHSGAVVEGNHVWKCGQSGIYSDAGSNDAIVGNWLWANQNRNLDIGPILAQSCTDYAVIGNIAIDGVTGNLVFTMIQQCTITGNQALNTVVGGDHSGLSLNGLCQFNAITGNSVVLANGQAAAGIFVNDAVTPSVGNFLSANVVPGATTPYSVNTTRNMVFDPLNAQALWRLYTKVIVQPRQAITLAASGPVAIDASQGDCHVALQANCTSTTINNGVTDQKLTISYNQDATGGRTFVPPANLKFPGGAAPAWDTTANSRSKITAKFDGATWWCETAPITGVR